jgi:cephalosporin-C deacetylase-like acetyl esterase
MNPYSYTPHKSSFRLRQNKINNNYTHFKVAFSAAFCGSHQENGTAMGEYYLPRNGGNHKLAILLHGNGKRSVLPLQFLARLLAREGVACFIVYLAIHPSRMPDESKKRFPRLSPEEWFEIYQTSVIEVRQIIDWAYSRKELDPKKIAIIGLSFGGFISAIAMGVDNRIGAGVFIVMGGNSERIHHDGRLSAITKFYRRTEAEYQHIQRLYIEYLDDIAENGFKNAVPARKSFLIDPMTFAHLLRQRPVQMYSEENHLFSGHGFFCLGVSTKKLNEKSRSYASSPKEII